MAAFYSSLSYVGTRARRLALGLHYLHPITIKQYFIRQSGLGVFFYSHATTQAFLGNWGTQNHERCPAG